MPDIFTKGCKVNLIEYGAEQSYIRDWDNFKKDILAHMRRLIAH